MTTELLGKPVCVCVCFIYKHFVSVPQTANV